MKNRVQVYLAGHEHTPQHLKPEGGVHLFINPAAGQGTRPAGKGPRTLYSGSYNGFSIIEASGDELKLRFVNADGETSYETTLR
jgi:hypothetical protein